MISMITCLKAVITSMRSKHVVALHTIFLKSRICYLVLLTGISISIFFSAFFWLKFSGGAF